MPQTCRACASSKRKEIDKAIAAGEPLRNIAKRPGIRPASLVRHKAHVSAAIKRAAEAREQDLGETVLARLERLYGRAEAILSGAEKARNGRLALASIHELRELLAGVFTLAAKSAPVQAGAIRCPDCQRAYTRDVRASLGFIDAEPDPVATLPESRQ